jgi:transposase-like protein
MSSRTRRRFSVERKAQMVRRHLGDKVPVSDLADEAGLQPSQIHAWVKQVLDQAEKAFGPATNERRSTQAKDAKITRIEGKLATKNEVIAELMEANVLLKKANGEL